MIARRQIKACRPSVDSQSSKHSADSGQLSEVSSSTSSNRSGGQTYRVSGRFERPGDTDEEAEAKNRMEHRRNDRCLLDFKKKKILMRIFGSQLRFRNQDRLSRMSMHSGDSDLRHSEATCESPPEEAKESGEHCSGGDAKEDESESEGAPEEEKESPKTDEGDDEDEEELLDDDPESEEGLDYDEKNDYNDYAYNLSCYEDSDDN
ncbi:uncharacterized protein [Macrobrachium rosenbergii]|uniref:uncharacterized protein n=1 Tax=Macrobrachium rosenbergii TaxID=79674 RepID=UPI0034D6F398